MKILHVITSLDVGGAETMLVKLLTSTAFKEMSSMVVSLTPPGKMATILKQNHIPVLSLNMKRGIANPLAILKLIKIIKNFNPDLLQSWMYHANIISTIATKITKKPLLWNIRCSNMQMQHYSLLSLLVVKFSKILSKSPTTIIINSHAGKTFHTSQGFNPRSWEIIANGFDCKRFHPNNEAKLQFKKLQNLPPSTPIIGMIARWDHAKDHATFIKAAKIVKKELPNAKFLLAGASINANNKTLITLLNENSMLQDFILLDEISNIETILPAMDVACLSSSFGEGFPNVIGEAMACDIPCVATDVGDCREIIANSGLVTPIKDSEAFARAILSIIKNPAIFSPRSHLEKHYEIGIIAAEYRDLYLKTIKNPC